MCRVRVGEGGSVPLSLRRSVRHPCPCPRHIPPQVLLERQRRVVPGLLNRILESCRPLLHPWLHARPKLRPYSLTLPGNPTKCNKLLTGTYQVIVRNVISNERSYKETCNVIGHRVNELTREQPLEQHERYRGGKSGEDQTGASPGEASTPQQRRRTREPCV